MPKPIAGRGLPRNASAELARALLGSEQPRRVALQASAVVRTALRRDGNLCARPSALSTRPAPSPRSRKLSLSNETLGLSGQLSEAREMGQMRVTGEDSDFVTVGNPRFASAPRACEPVGRLEPTALLPELQTAMRTFKSEKRVEELGRECHAPGWHEGAHQEQIRNLPMPGAWAAAPVSGRAPNNSPAPSRRRGSASRPR
jgi:hypothetical protein